MSVADRNKFRVLILREAKIWNNAFGGMYNVKSFKNRCVPSFQFVCYRMDLRDGRVRSSGFLV